MRDHLFEADCIVAEQQLDRLYTDNARLRAINAELAGALSAIDRYCDQYVYSTYDIQAMARAALLKAKEQK